MRRAGHRKPVGCEQRAQEQNGQEHRGQEPSTSNLSRRRAVHLLECRHIVDATIQGVTGRVCACMARAYTTSFPTQHMRILPKPSVVPPLSCRLCVLNTFLLEHIAATPMQCTPIAVPNSRYEFCSGFSQIILVTFFLIHQHPLSRPKHGIPFLQARHTHTQTHSKYVACNIRLIRHTHSHMRAPRARTNNNHTTTVGYDPMPRMTSPQYAHNCITSADSSIAGTKRMNTPEASGRTTIPLKRRGGRKLKKFEAQKAATLTKSRQTPRL